MRPQVLLLGNGINRAYGGVSWGKFLNDIATRQDIIKYIESGNKLSSPMPLQAILITNNSVDSRLKIYSKDAFGNLEIGKHIEQLQKVLSLGFDEILTTNYSYELEMAAYGNNLGGKQICKLQRHTPAVKRADGKYLIHTYNEVGYGNVTNRIWHIHGEARKPDSMVLGHYYYGNLLRNIMNHIDSRNKSYQFSLKVGKLPSITSWIDAFIFGDVYILGFGMDLSEIDLWWLLNRKINEKGEHGNVYFYEPLFKIDRGNKNHIDERLELIKIFVGKDNVYNMGVAIPSIEKSDGQNEFETFYNLALADIESKVKAGAEKEEMS